MIINDFYINLEQSLIIGFAAKQRWGVNRVGPHNKEVLDLIFGSLLGEGYKEYKKSKVSRYSKIVGETTEGARRAYGYWLQKFLYDRDYTAKEKPN
jgi:hypothetical protein